MSRRRDKRLTLKQWVRFQIRWRKFKREHKELFEWAKDQRS